MHPQILTKEYLLQRHSFWKQRIASRKIWNEQRFGKVRLEIRKSCKSYRGRFVRKVSRKLFLTKVDDSIVLSVDVNNFDIKEIDNVLVHEMIHQYIVQTGLRDNSPHGRIFRSFRDKINSTFEGELYITVSVKRDTSSAGLHKEGSRYLILLVWTKTRCYCCVVNEKNTKTLGDLLFSYYRKGFITKWLWGVSTDAYFSSFSRCRSRFAGKSLSPDKVDDFIETHAIELTGKN